MEFEIIIETLGVLAGMAGLGMLVSMLVNVFKMFGWVKDGQSETWVQGMNFVLFLIIAGVRIGFNDQVEWGEIDILLGQFASLIGLVIQIIGSKVWHGLFAGMPVIGTSFSHEKEAMGD